MTMWPRPGRTIPVGTAQVARAAFPKGCLAIRIRDAVRGRIDWKYALGLELTDTGFGASMLSEFRAGWSTAVQRNGWLLERMLERLRAQGLLVRVVGSAPMPPAWWRRCGSSTGWRW